jgi:hypothetical protein
VALGSALIAKAAVDVIFAYDKVIVLFAVEFVTE